MRVRGKGGSVDLAMVVLGMGSEGGRGADVTLGVDPKKSSNAHRSANRFVMKPDL